MLSLRPQLVRWSLRSSMGVLRVSKRITVSGWLCGFACGTMPNYTQELAALRAAAQRERR